MCLSANVITSTILHCLALPSLVHPNPNAACQTLSEISSTTAYILWANYADWLQRACPICAVLQIQRIYIYTYIITRLNDNHLYESSSKALSLSDTNAVFHTATVFVTPLICNENETLCTCASGNWLATLHYVGTQPHPWPPREPRRFAHHALSAHRSPKAAFNANRFVCLAIAWITSEDTHETNVSCSLRGFIKLT